LKRNYIDSKKIRIKKPRVAITTHNDGPDRQCVLNLGPGSSSRTSLGTAAFDR